MTIYKKKSRDTKIARKIYETHYGPIPIDDDNRKFEIHHIDSDHGNNSIENLLAIPIREHYDIHYNQGDWGACYAIGIRMKMSSEELSVLSSNAQKKLVENGTHHFVTNNPTYRMLEDGTHHLLGGDIQRVTNAKRVADGTHNFCDSETATERNLKRVAEGTHHFLDVEKARERANKMVEDGTHPFLDAKKARDRANKRISEGTHNLIGPDSPSQLQWTCDDCGKSGKGKGNQTQHRKKYCKKA